MYYLLLLLLLLNYNYLLLILFFFDYHDREGKYSLDIRSIAELSEYIKKNVLDDDDLIECPICLDYIFSDVNVLLLMFYY